MNSYSFSFTHSCRTVTFHYCADEEEAKVRFQERYGYWPADAIECRPTQPMRDGPSPEALRRLFADKPSEG